MTNLLYFLDKNSTILDVNECTSKPCGEHDCVDLFNGYKCNCGRGFNGTRCEINIDECAHHACENNATCVDGDNQYTCVCHGRYKGEFCDIQISKNTVCFVIFVEIFAIVFVLFYCIVLFLL